MSLLRWDERSQINYCTAKRDSDRAITFGFAAEGIGVDSLDVIEIVFALEEKFGITINYNANRSANEPFDTVAQVAAAVNKLLSDSRS